MNRIAKLWNWLKYPVAVGILVALWLMNRQAIAGIADRPKNRGYFQLAIVLIAGSTLLTFVRWYLLVRAQQFPFRLRDAIRLGFIGLIFNYVGPGAVGGDLFKAVLLARDQKSRRAAAVATILLDRILGLLALFMVGAVASLMPIDIPPSPELKLATALLWIGSLAGLAGIGLMLLPGITHWRWVQRLTRLRWVGHVLGELIYGVRLYQSQPGALVAALLLSLVGHAGLISGFYCCALWMQQPWVPNLTMHFYFMPNAELFGTVMFLLPGGVGALEGAVEMFYALLRPSAVAAEQAEAAGLVAALGFRIVTVCIAAVGGGYYLVARREVTAALHEAAAERPAIPTPP